MYQTDARVFALVLVLTFPGRQNEWMSSASPVATPVRPDWFHPDRQNSQFPSLGTPDPPPTDVEEFSAITVDCNAGGMEPNADGWANVPAHWLTTAGAGRPPKAVRVPVPVRVAPAFWVASEVRVPTPVRVAFPAPDSAAVRVPVPDRVAVPAGPPCAVRVPVPVRAAVPDAGAE